VSDLGLRGSRITKLATIRPTVRIALYSSPELEQGAGDVETTLDLIMAEAAG
jgi:hypothetical protein